MPRKIIKHKPDRILRCTCGDEATHVTGTRPVCEECYLELEFGILPNLGSVNFTGKGLSLRVSDLRYHGSVGPLI